MVGRVWCGAGLGFFLGPLGCAFAAILHPRLKYGGLPAADADSLWQDRIREMDAMWQDRLKELAASLRGGKPIGVVVCPHCNEWVESDSVICPHCKEWISDKRE